MALGWIDGGVVTVPTGGGGSDTARATALRAPCSGRPFARRDGWTAWERGLAENVRKVLAEGNHDRYGRTHVRSRRSEPAGCRGSRFVGARRVRGIAGGGGGVRAWGGGGVRRGERRARGARGDGGGGAGGRVVERLGDPLARALAVVADRDGAGAGQGGGAPRRSAGRPPGHDRRARCRRARAGCSGGGGAIRAVGLRGGRLPTGQGLDGAPAPTGAAALRLRPRRTGGRGRRRGGRRRSAPRSGCARSGCWPRRVGRRRTRGRRPVRFRGDVPDGGGRERSDGGSRARGRGSLAVGRRRRVGRG